MPKNNDQRGGSSNETDVPVCSFCGRPINEVGSKVAIGLSGPVPAFICASCASIVHEGALNLAGQAREGDPAQENSPFEHLFTVSGCSPRPRFSDDVAAAGGDAAQRPTLKAAPTPAEIKAALDEAVIGQEAAKVILAVAASRHYKRVLARGKGGAKMGKSNILMMGPTGCGKTLLAETLAKAVDVPFAILDATSLTENGYNGDDAVSVLSALYQAAGDDVARAETGIVFLDEMDKQACRENAYRNAYCQGVQYDLLKMVEGGSFAVPVNGRKAAGNLEDCVRIDTHGILFICGGAFVGLDGIVRKRLGGGSAGVGFLAELKGRDGVGPGDALASCEAEDLVKFGLIPEFVGRFPVRVALEALDEDAMLRVLTEPKGSLVGEYREEFRMDGLELAFTQGALRAVARKAMGEKTGARGLRSVMEGLMTPITYKLASWRKDGDEMCLVGENTVVRGERPSLGPKSTLNLMRRLCEREKRR